MKTKLIAPCGMNCGICMAHLRKKNHCVGCRNPDEEKATYCRECIITNCDKLNSRHKHCWSGCDRFPCKRLKALDKRYRTKYDMSMIENLACIEEHGIREFVKREKVRWKCKHCGGTINVHRKVCSKCAKER